MIKRFYVDVTGALEYVQTLEQDKSALGVQSAGWASERRTDKPEPMLQLLTDVETLLNSVARSKRTAEWWAVYLPRFAFIREHTHSSDWVAVVYIDKDYGDGQLIFDAQFGYGFDDEYRVTPEQGLCVIFPGVLAHAVTPSRAAHRYSLAINRV